MNEQINPGATLTGNQKKFELKRFRQELIEKVRSNYEQRQIVF